MTPSERERRVEAAQQEIREAPPMTTCHELARRALDAADEAVPMVSEEQHRRQLQIAAADAEAVARDFANALCYLADRESWLGDPLDQRSTLHGHFTPCELARDVLARHPSFSGDRGMTEGTDGERERRCDGNG